MNAPDSSTIYAPATAPGRAGIAVIRISGAGAEAALTALTGAPPPPPRTARRVRLRAPGSGEALDDGLCLWFPAPASYTGEDVAELHIHGGRAVAAAVLAALAGLGGLRPAEPGEFTRRAFDNGKLDLTAVEGLADLIEAETEAQRRQALRQLDGALSRLYDGWRERLLRARALAEAAIDFSDEELPSGIQAEVNYQILGLIAEILLHIDDGGRGERLREGLHIAILGPPNVGKSSLLNALARREAAIVSEIAGTTRDVIELQLDLGGLPVVIADTAGLREAADAVEGEGVRRALARAAAADLKLVMVDATVWPEMAPAVLALIDADAIVVVNKVDRHRPAGPLVVAGQAALALSLVSGEGVEELLARLGREVAARLAPGSAPGLTRARHRAALEECLAALRLGARATQPELVAEELRLGARALGRITGRVDVEDMLDLLFAELCIGK